MPGRWLRPSAPPSTSFTLYRSDDPMSVRLHKVGSFDSVELALQHLNTLYADVGGTMEGHWHMGIMYIPVPNSDTHYEIWGN